MTREEIGRHTRHVTALQTERDDLRRQLADMTADRDRLAQELATERALAAPGSPFATEDAATGG